VSGAPRERLPSALGTARPSGRQHSDSAHDKHPAAMFKRFTVDEDVSAQTAIKSSAIRAIKSTIEEQFPVTQEYMDAMIPKKAVVLEGKG
jgi:hypothetical protein